MLANFGSLNDNIVHKGTFPLERDFSLPVAVKRDRFYDSDKGFIRPTFFAGKLGSRVVTHFIGVNAETTYSVQVALVYENLPTEAGFRKAVQMLVPEDLITAEGSSSLDPDNAGFLLHGISTTRSSSGSTLVDNEERICRGNTKPCSSTFLSRYEVRLGSFLATGYIYTRSDGYVGEVYRYVPQALRLVFASWIIRDFANSLDSLGLRE